MLLFPGADILLGIPQTELQALWGIELLEQEWGSEDGVSLYRPPAA